MGEGGPPRRILISVLLTPQLETSRSALEKAVPRFMMDLRRWLHELERTGSYATAVKAGDLAPPFTLWDQRGARVSLSELLDHGPAVLSFFRGAWCNFCGLELKALAHAHREIERLGATLVALSPLSFDQASDPALTFPILKDKDCKVASLYGLAVSVPRDLEADYIASRRRKRANNRPRAWLLPVPATYVVDTTGRVVLSYVDIDYTTRLEPTEIIVALVGLRGRATSLSSLNVTSRDVNSNC